MNWKWAIAQLALTLIPDLRVRKSITSRARHTRGGGCPAGAQRLCLDSRFRGNDTAELILLRALSVALTTVWMIHVGDWWVHSGRQPELAPPDKADYSLFRLGRDYLQRARTLEQRIPVGFTVGPST